MPYDRGAGMGEHQAAALASTVEADIEAAVEVRREGRYFVVRVETGTGSWTLRDEADWGWLLRQLGSST